MYARVLVNVNMSEKLFDSVLVEREGYTFPVEIQYERQPLFCSHCKTLGHSIQQCKRLGVGKVKEPFAQGKKRVSQPQGPAHTSENLHAKHGHTSNSEAPLSFAPQTHTSPTTNHSTNFTLQGATFTQTMQPSTKRKNVSVSFRVPDLNFVSNHQAKDKAVVNEPPFLAPIFSSNQEALDDQSLDLHNSFDILGVEKDQTDARNLVSSINLEVSSFEEGRPSEIVGITTDQQLKLND